jgi:hypothetical protein
MPYDLEILILGRAAMPFRVPEISAEERVREIVQSFLAAWGIPVPPSLRDNGKSTFAERLIEDGGFQYEERGNYALSVKVVA